MNVRADRGCCQAGLEAAVSRRAYRQSVASAGIAAAARPFRPGRDRSGRTDRARKTRPFATRSPLQEQLGFKFVTDGEFRRRSYHSFFYGELGELRIDTIGGADAVGTEKGEKEGGGRGAQPMAVIGSRVQWTHPINAGDVAFLKANSDACRRSPSRGLARCTSAAAMPP